MTNGNDWSNQPGGDWNAPSQPAAYSETPQSESLATQAPSNHPLGNNQFNFGAFIEVVKLTLHHAKETPVLKAFIGLALVSLVFNFAGGAVQFMGALLSGALATALGIMVVLVSLVLIPIFILIAGAQYSLYRPLVERLSGRVPQESEPVAMIKATKPRLFMVTIAMLLVGVATILGGILCLIPGLIAAFFLSQAPYLVATQDEELVAAFQRSAQRAMKHWHVLLMAIVPMVAVLFIVAIVMVPMNIVIAFLGAAGYLISPIVQWVAATLVAVIGFCISTAAFATIDELEGERVIQP